MSFKNFINAPKSDVLESFYAVTDGKKYYDISGHSHNIELFKNSAILFDKEDTAENVFKTLTDQDPDGYKDLRVVKVNISIEIKG